MITKKFMSDEVLSGTASAVLDMSEKEKADRRYDVMIGQTKTGTGIAPSAGIFITNASNRKHDKAGFCRRQVGRHGGPGE